MWITHATHHPSWLTLTTPKHTHHSLTMTSYKDVPNNFLGGYCFRLELRSSFFIGCLTGPCFDGLIPSVTQNWGSALSGLRSPTKDIAEVQTTADGRSTCWFFVGRCIPSPKTNKKFAPARKSAIPKRKGLFCNHQPSILLVRTVSFRESGDWCSWTFW